MKILKYLLFFNLFFLQSYLLRFTILSYPSNLQEALIALTAVVFLIMTIKEKKFLQTIINIKNHRIIFLFIILTALSLMTVTPINYLDFVRYLKFLFFALILSFIFLEVFHTNEARKNAIKVAGFGAIAFGIFSLIYNLIGYNVAYDLRLLGPLDAAVYLAYYLAPFFLFFAIEFLENFGQKTREQKINLISAILLLILILATRSAGAILGSFLILCFYFLKSRSEIVFRKKSTKIGLIFLGILVIAITFYAKILPAIQTNYSSLNERGEIWQTSIHLLQEPKNWIVGLGFGQFQEYYKNTVDLAIGHKPLDYYVLQPHNILLLFVFNFGILGLLFIVLSIYRVIKKLFKYKGLPDMRIIACYIALYFFAHGMIDTPFFKNDLLFLLILFMEMALTPVSEPQPKI